VIYNLNHLVCVLNNLQTSFNLTRNNLWKIDLQVVTCMLNGGHDISGLDKASCLPTSRASNVDYTECCKVKSYLTNRRFTWNQSLPFYVLYGSAGISVYRKRS
jgi:hypothetical protein